MKYKSNKFDEIYESDEYDSFISEGIKELALKERNMKKHWYMKFNKEKSTNNSLVFDFNKWWIMYMKFKVGFQFLVNKTLKL